MHIVFSINRKDYVHNKTILFFSVELNYFQRREWSSSSVRINLTVPSFKRTQPPFWLRLGAYAKTSGVVIIEGKKIGSTVPNYTTLLNSHQTDK
jgi:hypothetical protein